MMSADDMNRDLDLEVEAKPAATANTSSKSHGDSKMSIVPLRVSATLTRIRQIQIIAQA